MVINSVVMYEAQLTQRSLKKKKQLSMLVSAANLRDQLEPVDKSVWAIFRPHAKFPIVWISIQMTVFCPRKFTGQDQMLTVYQVFETKNLPPLQKCWTNLHLMSIFCRFD